MYLVSRSLYVFLFTIRKMEIITTLQPVRTEREVYKEMLKEIKWQIYSWLFAIVRMVFRKTKCNTVLPKTKTISIYSVDG